MVEKAEGIKEDSEKFKDKKDLKLESVEKNHRNKQQNSLSKQSSEGKRSNDSDEKQKSM